MATINILSASCSRMITVFKAHSVEMGLFAATYIALVLKKNEVTDSSSFLVLIPIFITAAYCLNMLFRNGLSRQFYYWSWLPIFPLLAINSLETWSHSSQYLMTMTVICPVAILLSRRAMNSERFIDELLSYIYAGILSLGLSGIIFALASGINYSILYILGLDTGRTSELVAEYSGRAIFLLLCPTIFFSLLSFFLGMRKKGLRLFDILVNYIFTPALLIYTAILYSYFIRITLLWELPKGGIAYMVFAFTMFALVVKAMQYFVSHRLYDWFFNRFSLISIPAQIMFWIGVTRRVNEFGLTESRIWLIVCGAVMTLFLVAFLWKRSSNYFYLFACIFVIGILMAYIPFLSAQRIAIDTQYATAVKLSASTNLGLYEARRLLAAIEYLGINDEKLLNTLQIKSKEELLARTPADIRALLEQPEEQYKHIYLSNDRPGFEMNIPTGFHKILVPSSLSKKEVHYTLQDNILQVFTAGKSVLLLDIADFMEGQIRESGCSFSETELEKAASKLLIYKDDSTFLRLSNVQLRLNGEQIEITSLNISFVLIKEENHSAS